MSEENVHIHDAKVQVDRNACKPTCTVFFKVIWSEQKFKWKKKYIFHEI